jgi:hypothetical protein
MAGERADKPLLELEFRMGSVAGGAQLFSQKNP